MIFARVPPRIEASRRRIREAYLADEGACVEALIPIARYDDAASARVQERARRLVGGMRADRDRGGNIEAFLAEYALSNEEGVILMCLAEALLRVPDADTATRLIRDKIGAADWARHIGHSRSFFVNASTWGLMLTGRVVELAGADLGDPAAMLGRVVARGGEPLIRQAVTQAMRIMSRQFVLGESIGEALHRAPAEEARGYRYSFDMLGEAARTMADADRYFEVYMTALGAIADASGGRGAIDGPGLSVKLSALHPRYQFSQRDRVMDELLPRLIALAAAARDADIGLTFDAEEAERLDISLDVIAAVVADPGLRGWDGLGLAVQAYQKRALALIDWLADLGRRHKRRLMLRLVKGAYWDSEIKRAQELGLDGYPVFTRKSSTDLSYLACARRVLDSRDAFYPQFATHNAHSVAAVIEMAGGGEYEFQRLHGMGEALYDQIVEIEPAPCRIYAPVGSHEDLLPYLVRRLLENGANTSFVNRLGDEAAPIDEIVADPVARSAGLAVKPHPRIPLPADLFGAARRNSRGLDLSDPAALHPLAGEMAAAAARPWRAAPMIAGVTLAGEGIPVTDPADRRRIVGEAVAAGVDDVDRALASAAAVAPDWDRTPADDRARCLERMADLLEERRAAVLALLVREAGKTLADSVAELREAVDYCRYYAALARRDFGAPAVLPGPTGEENRIALRGRGVFACISPWNFPLAIFLGQIAGAIGAGNAVIAKPAEQTALIAAFAVSLLHEAGVPAEIVQLLPGAGATVGAALVADSRVAGVSFTGSTEIATAIHRALAARGGPIAPLIAETGGVNAMIADSTALVEQLTDDVIRSAFLSAGQRCSALRVLFVQEEIAPRFLEMLTGAMAELRLGDPALLETDIGPVIDADARAGLADHAARMAHEGRLLYGVPVPAMCASGTFFAPAAFEIESLGQLPGEVFGPILHVIRYRADRLDAVIEAINATGYGLTFGIHSRIAGIVDDLGARLKVGNIYVNRAMTGAVVGVQPFGGEGLSGTGPKAGGPRYLHRFATERTLSINTAAAGGNVTLATLAEDDAI